MEHSDIMLEIQKYLRHWGVEKTIGDFSLKHKRQDGYLLLNYDQLNSPKFSQPARECRCLILDDTTFQVYNYPFERFFNYGEEPHHSDFPFNAPNSYIQTKHDGSCVGAWMNKRDELVFSTRSQLYGEGKVSSVASKVEGNTTYAELARSLINIDKLMLTLYTANICLVFELVGPQNRIVRWYNTAQLILIGGRRLSNLVELSRYELDVIANNLLVERPATHQFDSFAAIQDAFLSMPPTDEGFVLVNEHGRSFNRIKLKNSTYVALHHSLSGDPTKYLWEIALKGEQSEISTIFPEFKVILDDYAAKLQVFAATVMNTFNQLQRKNLTRKEFAMEAVCYPYSAALFQLLDGSITSPIESLQKVSTEKSLSIVKEM